MRFFFLLLILLQTVSLLAAQPVVRFDRLSIAHGLSQSVGNAVFEDQQGFMWFGTADGLNRYDGYQFKQFRYDPNDSSSLSSNHISVIHQDSRGILWIGTLGGGLNRFDRQTQRFTHIRHDGNNLNSLSHDDVTAIEEDDQGYLWIGTVGGGLNRFDVTQSRFKRFYHVDSDPRSLSNDHVKAIFSDDNATLWVGTEGGGLNRFDPATGGFIHFKHQPDDSTSLSHNAVRAIFADARGELWVGTFGGGLNRYDGKSQRFERFVNNKSDPYSLINDSVWTINEDSQGTLWIGTQEGLSRLNPNRTAFANTCHQSSDPYSLSNNTIRTIYRDGQGLLWLGTFGGGINRVDIRQRQFGHFKHNASDSGSLSDNMVFSIDLDSKGALWIGTYGGGLNRQLGKTGDFERFVHHPDNPNSLSNNYVWTTFEDSDGVFWVGTNGGPNQMDASGGAFKPFEHDHQIYGSIAQDSITAVLKDSKGVLWFGTRGQGLIRFEPNSRVTQRYNHKTAQPNSLSNDVIMTVFEDTSGNVWIGTHNGLNRYDEQQNHFERFVHDKDNSTSLSQGFVASVYEDSKGRLWIGTSGGLNKFNGANRGFSHFGEAEGLVNEVVYCVTEDLAGYLWMSTNQGLSAFNPRSGKFKNYDVSVGLQSNEFNLGACLSSPKGELFFGGINGFNRFFPEDLQQDKQPVKVVFTEFLLFNQEVPVQSDVGHNNSGFELPMAIDQLKDLSLGYQQSLIAFEFAALDYRNPVKNQYEYKLEGYDDNWIKADARIRRATYTSLPAGDYTLRVRASNADGFWSNNSTSINIHVSPAPWLSWWAFVIYVAIFVLAVCAFVHHRIERSKMIHELSVIDKLKQLDKLKDSFLANTSHELRTPINGIIGLAESLMDGVSGPLPKSANNNLAMVVTSGKRLSRLVNDILDLSKLKHLGIELHTQPVDLHALTDVVLTLSKPLLGDKEIELVNDIARSLPLVEADEDRLQQILLNLVSNAVKFTDSGMVAVSAKIFGKGVKVSVIDSGIGIGEDKFATIFNSFEQVQGDANRVYGGTGLGLAITRQLVELHSGTIEVASELGQGSTFSFTLLASDEKQRPAVPVKPTVTRPISINPETQPKESMVFDKVDREHEGSNFRLLLVDDEPINLQILHNHLSMQNYQLVEVPDGQQALKAMEEQGPFDMVLLDIMMPVMTGYEVCKILRQTYSVSELPIIFLTAKNQIEDLVCGFEIGANDHLIKPVAKHELLSRVEIHLKMHDINRNLDRIVSERTAEIVATQQKLVLSEKLASLGTLMAGVAHEINNPTNFVNVSVQNLEADLDRCQQFIFNLAADEADEEILDSFRNQFSPLFRHMDTIKEGTNRIKTIVKDLKTSSHMNEAQKSTVCITEILMSTVNLVFAKYQHEVEIVTDFQATPIISCYPSKLNQVFMNLLVNACDALEAQPEARIDVGCRVTGQGQVEISVRDNGCGMSRECRSKLFEPFYTTKGIDKGTGLGLSISYDIVDKHGGELTVESELGVGSVFYLTLPL